MKSIDLILRELHELRVDIHQVHELLSQQNQQILQSSVKEQIVVNKPAIPEELQELLDCKIVAINNTVKISGKPQIHSYKNLQKFIDNGDPNIVCQFTKNYDINDVASLSKLRRLVTKKLSCSIGLGKNEGLNYVVQFVLKNKETN